MATKIKTYAVTGTFHGSIVYAPSEGDGFDTGIISPLMEKCFLVGKRITFTIGSLLF